MKNEKNLNYSSLRSLLFGEYSKVISLGSFCFTRMFLNRMGLEQWTGPFDWSASFDHEMNGVGGVCGKIKQILSEENVFNSDKLVQCSVSPSVLPNQIHKCYANTSNGCDYLHDFHHNKSDPEFETEVSELNVKYSRRFNRLRECLKSGEKVLFLYIYEGERVSRLNGKIEYHFGNADFPFSQAIKTISELRRHFPNTHFLLLVSDPSLSDTIILEKTEGYTIYGIPNHFSLLNNHYSEKYVLSALCDFGHIRYIKRNSVIENSFTDCNLLGFCEKEFFGVWTNGDVSYINLRSSVSFDLVLLDCFPFLCKQKTNFSFGVFVNDICVCNIEINSQNSKFSVGDLLENTRFYLIKLPQKYYETTLKICFNETCKSPYEYGLSNDCRHIGLCIRSISLLSDE